MKDEAWREFVKDLVDGKPVLTMKKHSQAAHEYLIASWLARDEMTEVEFMAVHGITDARIATIKKYANASPLAESVYVIYPKIKIKAKLNKLFHLMVERILSIIRMLKK